MIIGGVNFDDYDKGDVFPNYYYESIRGELESIARHLPFVSKVSVRVVEKTSSVYATFFFNGKGKFSISVRNHPPYPFTIKQLDKWYMIYHFADLKDLMKSVEMDVTITYKQKVRETNGIIHGSSKRT